MGVDPLFAAAAYRDEIDDYTAHYLPAVRASLIAGQVHQESQWNPRAVSRSGAGGLLQIMPATGRDIALSCKIPGFDRFNPVHALRGGICYDAQVRKWVGALNTPRDQDTAMLRAYNGGAGYIIKERHRAELYGKDGRDAAAIEPYCLEFRPPLSCKENLGYAPAIRRWQARYYAAW